MKPRVHYTAYIYMYILAVPVRRWRPVMRRTVMPTKIMSSPEPWNIQPSRTMEVRVKVTIPTLWKSSGYSSVDVTRTFAEKPKTIEI